MSIYLFRDHTGMVDARVVPAYKTEIAIYGSVSQGTLIMGSRSYEIKDNFARVPIDAFTGERIDITVTAKEKGNLRHWCCGKLIRDKADGSYAPDAIDGNAALLKARLMIEALMEKVDRLEVELKKHKERSSKKFLGGNES